MRRVLITALAWLLPAMALAEPVSTGALVDQMTDLHRLCYFPDPAYKTVQFSSHDRRSTLPGGPGWFSNSDGFGDAPVANYEAVLRAPVGELPGEYLLCDVKGPGALVRTWTARIAGELRVYLDGNETPLYEGPAEDFLRFPYNPWLEAAGLAPETLDGTFYQRDAAYAPIPFAKGCRVVWAGRDGDTRFYELQFRLYPEGTEVSTFTPADLKTYAGNIARAAAALADPGANWPLKSMQQPRTFENTVRPGRVEEALALDGQGAIEQLVLKMKAADIDMALRQVMLHIRFDDYPWGQVQAPVGDFFGAGPGINPYTSAPFTVASDGAMTCRYVMPYKQSCRILFDNKSGQEVTVSGSVLPVDYAWDDARSMHFRARWRIDHDLTASGDAVMGVQDLPFLMARGQGVYVGTAVMVLNTSPVPTPHGGWWGEGDEKIFVDDDRLPSTFGTGSEDYFNYSWSAYDLFDYPYCGQPRDDGPGNRGNVVNYRWHILDPLPFTDSIAFYMELFSHMTSPGYAYGRIAYHYGRPGMVDDHVALTGRDLEMPRLPETWEPLAVGGAARSMFYGFEDLPGRKRNAEVAAGPLWQGGKVLVWTPRTAGDELRFSFSVDKTGDYALSLACMLLPGGGSFTAAVDGSPLAIGGGRPVSLTAPQQVQSRLIDARWMSLTEGAHELTITSAEAGKPIGLDFLAVKRR